MTASPESTRPATRRSLRETARTRAILAAPAPVADERDTGAEEPGLDELAPALTWADEQHPTTALAWLDPESVTAAPGSVSVAASAPPLFAGSHLTPAWRRARVAIPLSVIVALCATYAGGTLLAPLDNVAPVLRTTPVQIAAAPVATVAWPEIGSAAVAVQGIAPVSSTTERDQIASISKIATVLMVLDKLPLKVGEQGPEFAFTWQDQRDYQRYRWRNESSLDVPVDGTLTEYQMLQGVLLGSANNYIDRLADELWGSKQAFADASAIWLRDHGIDGISLESPSGFDTDNVASPEALLRLGELAMRNPVLAEIVGTRSAEIPGVGLVQNTNRMLDDPGVIGIKTGTLDHWNLLTAKEVTVGDTTVRLFTSVLGQDSNDDRLAVTRGLLAGVEKTLAEQPVSVPKGTVVGSVTTEWGDDVEVVTDAAVRVVLWNGATASASTDLKLGDETTAGSAAGTLTAKGPIDSAETPVSLAKDVTAPSPWWRLTHPLELFGVDEQ
ncbi:D-alanyl-D-alanine carboxypeptidase [Microbacterium sp. ARD32]|uniref:D-alanyl-D-alanine carboxypeptidase family protein n=1 Tax=Microbacterium sp. ARD32 TaxID=2962577 RepID=UPI002880CA68|nr:D-alanyl-D-alanine carboxypeptidase [Microbacterium sp. ARD32]MDT0158072.1 D-alanyl-D-alanine carboxypeptidase [Microbacterium sp. ARD32]